MELTVLLFRARMSVLIHCTIDHSRRRSDASCKLHIFRRNFWAVVFVALLVKCDCNVTHLFLCWKDRRLRALSQVVSPLGHRLRSEAATPQDLDALLCSAPLHRAAVVAEAGTACLLLPLLPSEGKSGGALVRIKMQLVQQASQHWRLELDTSLLNSISTVGDGFKRLR